MDIATIYYKIRPMGKLHLDAKEENRRLTLLHKIYLTIIALIVLPFACLGLLLVIPATLDLNPAVLLFLTPCGIVSWDIVLLMKGEKIIKLKINLVVFGHEKLDVYRIK